MAAKEEKNEDSVERKKLGKDYRGLPPEYPEDERSGHTKEENEE